MAAFLLVAVFLPVVVPALVLILGDIREER